MNGIRVKSDHFDRYTKKDNESMEEFPVDLYGKRVTVEKNNPSNLQNIGKDIQKFYFMEGDYGLDGDK